MDRNESLQLSVSISPEDVCSKVYMCVEGGKGGRGGIECNFISEGCKHFRFLFAEHALSCGLQMPHNCDKLVLCLQLNGQ